MGRAEPCSPALQLGQPVSPGLGWLVTGLKLKYTSWISSVFAAALFLFVCSLSLLLLPSQNYSPVSPAGDHLFQQQRHGHQEQDQERAGGRGGSPYLSGLGCKLSW